MTGEDDEGSAGAATRPDQPSWPRRAADVPLVCRVALLQAAAPPSIAGWQAAAAQCPALRAPPRTMLSRSRPLLRLCLNLPGAEAVPPLGLPWTVLAGCAGYFDAPAALACPYGQATVPNLPDICIVVCAIDGLAAMKVLLVRRSQLVHVVPGPARCSRLGQIVSCSGCQAAQSNPVNIYLRACLYVC